jgi:phosphate:Na+ symporter
VEILNFWQLLAGLSFFLYGMFHLEDALKQLEGRSFKLFLKKHTKNKFTAISSGTIVTAILQSSSIVNLMVLSFVGAGILSMRNALGVVLGANIGGTFNSWLVAILGFKVDLGYATFPIIGIAGIGLVVLKNKKNYYNVARFIFGFGLLFMGLDFMKMSMDNAILNFDFKPFLKYHKIVFLLIGFVITALIQTSAATIVIVLSALNAQIIPIETAVAIVLGAELGTTVKVVLGSIGGIAAKKRVALGNSIFNLLSSFIGFVFLSLIVSILQKGMGIKDPLIILVAFQTFINLLGAVFFYFFLNQLGDFLDNSFVQSKPFASLYLQNASVDLPDAASEIFEKEVEVYIQRVLSINEEIFLLNEINVLSKESANADLLFGDDLSLLQKYEVLKKTEGEMLLFYTDLMKANIENEILNKVNRLLSAVRSALYAAKSLKDVLQDVKEFSGSSNEIKYHCFKDFQIKIHNFNTEVRQILFQTNKNNLTQSLNSLMIKVEKEYKQEVLNTYRVVSKGVLSELDISTVFNLNREVFDANKAIILALKSYLLTETEATEYDNL